MSKETEVRRQSKAADSLESIVRYGRMSAIHCLRPPSIKKSDIPDFISCEHFAKAKAKVRRVMERYESKVSDLKQRLGDSDANVEALRRAQRDVDPGKGFFVNESNPRAVAKYNNRLREARRLGEKIEVAIDKHNDLVDRHDEAVNEANERLEELTEEALTTIDDDIVAVLDRCLKIIGKLSRSQSSDDVFGAFETTFVALKVSATFDDFIEGNAARSDCKARTVELWRAFCELCQTDDVNNHIADIFRRNIYLIAENAKLYGEIHSPLSRVDQSALDEAVRALKTAIGREFETFFEYEGVVDPTELNALVQRMTQTIAGANEAIRAIREAHSSSGQLSTLAVELDGSVSGILKTMRSNVNGLENLLVRPGHFLHELLEDGVIEDFCTREARRALSAVRTRLVESVEERQVDIVLEAPEDLYRVDAAAAAIKGANLQRLERARSPAKSRVAALQQIIQAIESDLAGAGEVPQQNADAVRGKMNVGYAVSFLPWLGVIWAAMALSKVGEFAPAFRSPVEAYRDLGAELLGSAGLIRYALLVPGGLLAIFTLLLSLNVFGPSSPLPAAVPGSASVVYLLSSGLYFLVHHRLRCYLEPEKSSEPVEMAM